MGRAGSDDPTQPIAGPDAAPTVAMPAVEAPPGREPRAPYESLPRRADGVELLGEYEGSGFKDPRFVVRRPDGPLIQVTDLLYLVLEELDGSGGWEEIARRVSARYGRRVSADNVKTLVEGPLRKDGLIAGARAASRPKVDPLLGLKARITLLPAGAVNVVAALLRPLFWPPVVLAALAGLVVVDIWYFGSHGIAPGLRTTLMEPEVMVLVYGLMILSVGWHELGHATACRYGGARPGRIGFGIYVVWPAFFTDVTDVYRLGKWGRVRTDLGGVYFNVLFALGIAGVYALTRYEPILVLIVIQHLLMLYQFMPFLRLDGYHVVSDLTGVPDLFARIRPTLSSLAPWRETPREVTELKPWARTVVTMWVILAIPLLLYLFAMMILAAPRVIATAWDSLGRHWGDMTAALEGGEGLTAAGEGFRSVMLVLPATGMSITLARAGKRLLTGAVDVTRGRPVLRALAAALAVAALGGGAFVLWPNGDYRPISPNETWTAAEGIEALADVGSGKPSLGDSLDGAEEPAPDATVPGEDPTDSGDDEAVPAESPTVEESAVEEETATPVETATPTETPTEAP